MPATVFDPPERFVAGTVGPPGGRTFFLQASGEGRLVSVSLEKVQVSVLADRVNELLDAHAEGTATEPLGGGDTDPLATPIEDEFRVDTLALAWDPARNVLVIECHDQDPEEAEEDDRADPARRAQPRRGPGLRPTVRCGRRPPAAPPARSAASRWTRPATSALVPTDTDADLVDLLTSGDLTPVGRIVDSSNGALLCSVEAAGGRAVPTRSRAGARHPQAGGQRAAAVGLPRRHPRRPRAGRLPGQRGRAASTSCPRRCCATARSGRARCSCGSARSRGSPSRSSTSPRPTRCPTAGSWCSRASRPVGGPVVVVAQPRAGPAHRGGVRRRAQQLRPQGRPPAARRRRSCAAATTGSACGVEPKLRTVLWGWAGEPVPDADLGPPRDPARRPRATGSPTSSRPC